MAEKNDKENEKQAVEEPTYPIERLVGESEAFFGQPSHVIAGALHGDRKQNFTRDEVEAAVKKWLASEVTTEA